MIIFIGTCASSCTAVYYARGGKLVGCLNATGPGFLCVRQTAAEPMVCCRCNRSGRCKNCQCVKRGFACVDCLPSRQGACCNLPAPSSAPGDPTSSTVVSDRPAVSTSSVIAPAQPAPSVPTAPSNSGLCSVLPGCSASPVDVQGSPISPPLPSIETVLRVRVPTLRHVPKVSRDAWAGVVGDICQKIVSDPTDLGSWVKLFMLARCILANPSRGGRSHWRDTQKAVRTRIAKWRAGQLSELWDGEQPSQQSFSEAQQLACPS